MIWATLPRTLNAIRPSFNGTRRDGETCAAMPAVVAALCVALVGTVSPAASTGPAPRSQAKAAPSGEEPVEDVADVSDLDLQTAAFDRILLHDGTVQECEPLRPRPLPEMRGTDMLEFQPLEGGGETTKILWLRVEQVVYFEDLLIKKANLLIEQRQFDSAFEYLQAVQRRAAQWPGLEQAFQRLLFEEAASLLESGRFFHAVNLLAELRTRNPDYPDLGPLFDRGAEPLLAAAFRAKDYRRVRWLLVQLEAQFPSRPPVQRWREQLTQLAQSRADEALAKEAEGNLPEAAALIHEASRIWPGLAHLDEMLSGIFSKYTVVRVGVEQLPERFGTRVTTRAQRRAARLLYESLVAPPAVPEPESYQPELAERYEASNLGRRMTFELPAGRKWSDGTSPITAMDAAYALNRRSDPHDASYDASWARLAPAVQVDDPLHLTVDFGIPPLHPEAWFQFPVLPQKVMSGRRRPINQAALATAETRVPASGPYFVNARSSSQIDFRVNPHYGGRDAAAIEQLVEEQFPDSDRALRALVRGQVALVEHVPPSEVEKVRRLPNVTVSRYAIPRVHLIAFDFRTPALRVRSLRRAMVYAIDRETVLHNDVISGAKTDAGAVLPGIWRRESSYAHTTLKPRPYEPLLAAALVANAKVQLGGAIPPLKLHHPPDDVARLACRHIQAYLQAAGLEVQLVERSERALEEAVAAGQSLDLVYRIVTTTEPAVEVANLLSPVPVSGDAALRLSSPWMRQLLVRLQQAPNLPAARAALKEIDQVAHDEVAVLPLWQIADYFAHDRRLSGIGDAPLDLYESIERWRWEPTVLQDSFATTP